MKNKFTLKERVFFSPWAFLAVLFVGIGLMNVVAFADHDTENYERQKANIDMANDGIVGYTHDGFPVYQSEIDEAEADMLKAQAELQVDRALTITLKKIAIKEKYLNCNSVEINTGGNSYTIVLDCLITEMDTFEWVGTDGKLKIGHQVGIRRTPLKNWGNPDFSSSKVEKELLERAEEFDKFERQCTIQWIQKIKVFEEIETPEALEDVRG